MCGIIGYVGRNEAEPILIEGLRRLEYRGYDSAGLYRDYLRPGEIVLVVSDRGNAGMLFQADTNFYMRVAGGFINQSLSGSTGRPAPVALLQRPTPAREQRFRAYVREAGVGAILVERAWAAPWMQIFSRMGLHGTWVGGMIVYPTA